MKMSNSKKYIGFILYNIGTLQLTIMNIYNIIYIHAFIYNMRNAHIAYVNVFMYINYKSDKISVNPNFPQIRNPCIIFI